MYSRAKADDPTEYRIIVGEHNLNQKEGLLLHNSKTKQPILINFFIHVARGRGSVLL